jgi:hypothetical protein
MDVYEDTRTGKRYGQPTQLQLGSIPFGRSVQYHHDVLADGPLNKRLKSKYISLSNGDKGIRETLVRMKSLAREGAQHPTVWKVSRTLVGTKHPEGPVPVRDQAGEAQRLLGWVQNNIRWTPDIGYAETLAGPWRTIEVGSGDCDDSSITLGALATSIGIPNRFKAIAANRDYPDEYTHVYNEMKLNGRWVAADPSIQGVPLGWESPQIFKVMTEDVWTTDDPE